MRVFKSLIHFVTESRLPVYILIAVAVIFNVLTIQDGHQWNGDFALYVAHAKNIALGLPYADTGYVFNPYTPWTSPVAYPPVYPLFLSPVYRVFGLDIYAMKVAGLFVFSLFLLVFHRYVRLRLDSGISQIAVVAVVAFSPWVWVYKDQILPDFLFMFFTFAAIFLIDMRADENKSIHRPVLVGFFIGVFIYLSYGTRSLGLLLAPALILSDLIRHRKISRSTMVCILIFAGLYILQNTYLHTDKSYLDSYLGSLPLLQGAKSGSVDVGAAIESGVSSISLASVIGDMQTRIINNLAYYHDVMSSYWGSGNYLAAEKFMYAAMGLLAIAGFAGRVLRKPSSGDYFLVLYIIVLLLVPFRQNRYLLPLLPLYVIYIFQGVELLHAGLVRTGRANSLMPAIMQSGVLLAVVFFYSVMYSTFNFAGQSRGVEKDESVEMFRFVREHTPADSLIVFRKPRILALLGGRRSILYHRPDNPDDLWDNLVKTGVTHIVSHKRSSGILSKDDYLERWVSGYVDRLTTIFENNDFYVYRVEAG